MALIICKECGKEISEHATVCPHCGDPFRKVDISDSVLSENTTRRKTSDVQDDHKRGKKLPIIILAAILIIVSAIAFLWKCDANTASDSSDRYPGAVWDRTAQVYAALDELEAASCGKITHKEITESLDSFDLPKGETSNDNKMRLYKIDTTPSHITGGYKISHTPMYQKPKALIIAVQHGNERASANYVVDFIKRLLTDPELNSIASAFEWHIVPIVNVWGFNHNTRKNAPTEENPNGYDINRDYSDHEYLYDEEPYGFKTMEARTIKQLYLDNAYSLFLDIHQANFTGNTNRCGFTSIPNQLSHRLADYKKLWLAVDRAGCAAQLWAQRNPETIKTNEQITFNWGNLKNPAIGANASACAPAYIRGNPYWNASAADQNPVFCSATIETQKRCTIISGSDTDYNRVAMSFGAVYVQTIIKELSETIINNLDVYGTSSREPSVIPD